MNRERLRRYLLLHGAVILTCGLLSGAPFTLAITGDQGEAVVRPWRLAHSGLTMGGILLVALSGALPRLALGRRALGVLTAAFILSAYGFAVAMPLGAAVGMRGLQFGGPISNQLALAGNLVGVGGSLLGCCLLVIGAWRAGR
jgi:hypothetical protein